MIDDVQSMGGCYLETVMTEALSSDHAAAQHWVELTAPFGVGLYRRTLSES